MDDLVDLLKKSNAPVGLRMMSEGAHNTALPYDSRVALVREGRASLARGDDLRDHIAFRVQEGAKDGLETFGLGAGSVLGASLALNNLSNAIDRKADSVVARQFAAGVSNAGPAELGILRERIGQMGIAPTLTTLDDGLVSEFEGQRILNALSGKSGSRQSARQLLTDLSDDVLPTASTARMRDASVSGAGRLFRMGSTAASDLIGALGKPVGRPASTPVGAVLKSRGTAATALAAVGGALAGLLSAREERKEAEEKNRQESEEDTLQLLLQLDSQRAQGNVGRMNAAKSLGHSLSKARNRTGIVGSPGVSEFLAAALVGG